MGICNDQRIRSLAKDLGERCHRPDVTGNHIPQNIPGADRRQLVHIADQQKVGAWIKGFQEVVRQE